MRQNGTQQRGSGCVGVGWNEYGELCNGCEHTIRPCRACNSTIRPDEIPAGLVEATPDYPITLTIQRGEERFSINGVREDSISSKRDKLGNIVLSFELYSNPDAIGYVPCIDWYVTELEG